MFCVAPILNPALHKHHGSVFPLPLAQAWRVKMKRKKPVNYYGTFNDGYHSAWICRNNTPLVRSMRCETGRKKPLRTKSGRRPVNHIQSPQLSPRRRLIYLFIRFFRHKLLIRRAILQENRIAMRFSWVLWWSRIQQTIWWLKQTNHSSNWIMAIELSRLRAQDRISPNNTFIYIRCHCLMMGLYRRIIIRLKTLE